MLKTADLSLASRFEHSDFGFRIFLTPFRRMKRPKA
jgi:hypothetical protein